MDNNIHTTDSGGQQYTHYRQCWTTINTTDQTVVDNNIPTTDIGRHNMHTIDSGGQQYTH